ncbi:MAG: F0F1 ATP synthase subunit alpha [Candidatus Niyogibacteria bacterium CG10_big_fil_rev_8_21_14_0_10_42_19]|uniref:ATP synthase subunit alpha n=1 Tax=Candidatus Niyogibacteria bacterium CG10_big_fil_rev_8_21_14_0_10_42_19 TaxID=1974725 RepID=A0A2H0TEW6_9BACT|nr:MAG: F0F1 ATP synthase subunit alpha [Candidatus Niyogibacteria bacterium CG10_big_fil_rev_8_21_14_0_10_42_19]
MFEIIEKLKKEIEGQKSEIEISEVGMVLEVADGVLKIQGLRNVMSQEMLTIEAKDGPISAVVLNLEENSIGAIVLGDFSKVKTGDEVKGTGRVLEIKVGPNLIGRVINPLGEPLDGKGDIWKKGDDPDTYPIEKKAPSVLDRESVSSPLHTGIKAIDSMIPIGRGQRELIIGDRQTGKTAIAIDTIVNQQNEKGRKIPICIYVAIGQKESNIAKIISELETAGAMKYTIVVAASAASSAAFWFLAPYAGCALGEYFMDKKEDALIIYDDLSKHATAYRQISLLLRRPPGREAYPGDIFYLHSRLLERSAKLSKEKGGGSLTALPIIETQLSDVSAYIPTNVISITDGQIYLEADLFYQGIRPAINAGLSVSRVGSSAQTKAMKKVSGKLRLELAQARELQAFVQFASDLDENTKNKIKRGQMITEILKQNDASPMPFEEQALVFYAALNGYFDNIPVDNLKETEKKYLEYIKGTHQNDIIEPIRQSNELSAGVEEKLKEAIIGFKQTLS